MCKHNVARKSMAAYQYTQNKLSEVSLRFSRRSQLKRLFTVLEAMQTNLNNIAFVFTFFKDHRCN